MIIKNLYQKLELRKLTLVQAFKRHTVFHLIKYSCQLKELTELDKKALRKILCTLIF